MAALNSIISVSNSAGYVDDSSGLWSTTAANTARISNKGALFESAMTNYVRNNQWAGCIATDGVELLPNTGGVTFASAAEISTLWTVTTPGSTAISWISAGIVQLTGDGTNTCTLAKAFSVVAGRTYTLQLSNVTNAIGTVAIGTTAGAHDLVYTLSLSAGTWRAFTFVAASTGTVYLTLGQTAATSTRVVLPSVQWQQLFATPVSSWSYSNGIGTIVELRALGPKSGLQTASYRIWAPAGTASVGASSFYWDNTTGIASPNSQQWTLGAYLAKSAGSTANFTAVNITAVDRPSGTQLALSANFLGGLTSTLQRCTGNVTSTGTSTAVQPFILLIYAANAAIDMTIDIAMPMAVRASSYGGSPIATTTAAASRTADIATEFVATSFAAGAQVIYGIAPPTGAVCGAWAWDDGTVNNAHRLYVDAASVLWATAFSGGTQQAALNLGTLTPGSPFKVLYAWDSTGFFGTLNGGAIVTASGTVPSGLNTVRLGMDTAGNSFNSYISRASINNAKPNVGVARALTT